MKRARQLSLMAALLCMANSRPAPAADLIITLQGCTAMRDDAARLACYDKAMSRTTVTPEQTFGLSNAQVAKQEKIPNPEPTKITVKVIALGPQSNGGLLITVEPNQVWAEQDPSGKVFPIKIGDAVTIKPGLLGGFLLTGATPGSGSIRVKRMK